MTDAITPTQQTAFEQHIDDCIVSEAGLSQALERDGFGDYTTPWVQSKYVAFLAALREQPATTPREASDFQKWSVLAYRALDDAGRVLMTVEPECSTESDNLSVLTETIRELMYQALTLNGVLSRRDMDRKFHFSKLDSDALLREQPASGLQTAIRLVLEATPEQLPMAIDALRDFVQPDHSKLVKRLRYYATRGMDAYVVAADCARAADALECKAIGETK